VGSQTVLRGLRTVKYIEAERIEEGAILGMRSQTCRSRSFEISVITKVDLGNESGGGIPDSGIISWQSPGRGDLAIGWVAYEHPSGEGVSLPAT
jgi:hypothetical protein